VIHRAYIGLGSNVEPQRYLAAAVSGLSSLGEVAAVSGAYESAAVGDAAQPNFLNAAVLLKTRLSAERLCDALRAIESQLDRVRDPHNPNAPRTIDLDLALFDDAVLNIGHRRIPDPDILARPFLAVPLADLDPEFIHPETGEPLAAIAERTRKTGPALRARPDVNLRPPGTVSAPPCTA
jgi:2-amino-4-hydroxy-6-hydroxymethyldihydropteridine diphosphokinase